MSHEKKVEDVQAQVRDWIAQGRKKQMCTARPGTIVIKQYRCKLPWYFNPTISTMLNHHGILSLTPSTNGIKQYSGVFYHSLVILFYNTLWQ